MIHIDSVIVPDCNCGHDLMSHCQEDEEGLYMSPDGCFFCSCKDFNNQPEGDTG